MLKQNYHSQYGAMPLPTRHNETETPQLYGLGFLTINVSFCGTSRFGSCGAGRSFKYHKGKLMENCVHEALRLQLPGACQPHWQRVSCPDCGPKAEGWRFWNSHGFCWRFAQKSTYHLDYCIFSWKHVRNMTIFETFFLWNPLLRHE